MAASTKCPQGHGGKAACAWLFSHALDLAVIPGSSKSPAQIIPSYFKISRISIRKRSQKG